MARNEKTSKRVAALAGVVLNAPVGAGSILQVAAKGGGQFVMPWRNVKTLAASALTQTADRRPVRAAKKRKRLARRGIGK